MYCTNCGSPLPENAKFCPECGAPVVRMSATPTVPAAPAFTAQPVGTVPPAAPTRPAPIAEPAAPAEPRRTPWHSRGVLSPKLPALGRTAVSAAVVMALLMLQVGLMLLFSALWFESDAEEPAWLMTQAIGMIPVVVLVVYIFLLDAREHEPVRLLLRLFLVEAAVCLFVVGDVEEFLYEFFAEFTEDEWGVPFMLVDTFICTAMVEEGFKFIVLYWCTWRNKAFNYRFDGVVYAAVTALGFAACENIFYIDAYGLGTALTRAVTAIPGHCADGILMGVFYGQARVHASRGDKKRARRCLLLSLLVPILEHGFYDFAAGLEEEWIMILFELYILLLNAVIFTVVWRQAQKDEAVRPTPYAPAADAR